MWEKSSTSIEAWRSTDVTFQDGSSDYVTNDDIDGTDLILL